MFKHHTLHDILYVSVKELLNSITSKYHFIITDLLTAGERPVKGIGIPDK